MPHGMFAALSPARMDRARATLTIDSRLEHVYVIGLVVNGLCTAAGLSELETRQVELSVIEAVNNAIEHGYGGAAGHPVEVQVDVEPDSLTFAIADQGVPMPAGAGSPAVASERVAMLAEGGRGLLIMEAYMDRVAYERRDGRNVRTLVKRRTVIAPVRTRTS
jgi:anti-sigma regulatory factor (Ser/Thr protein kinase)